MQVEESDKINRRLLNKLNQGEEVTNYRQVWYKYGDEIDEPDFEPIVKKQKVEVQERDSIRELRKQKESERDALLTEDVE
jgi:hypothetical protein